MEDLKFKMTLKERFKAAKWRVENKVRQGIDWARENKELVTAAVPVVTAVIGAGSRIIAKGVRHANLKKETEHKTRYIYDRRNGCYWTLKRDLSNNERLQIDQRKKNGESIGDILSSMKVLK